MARRQIAPVILAILLAATGAGGAAGAEDCLDGPNAPSPQGSHWFYHLDRATHRKCWYLGEAKRRRPASARAVAASEAAAPPEAAPTLVPSAQAPADEPAPNSTFGTRRPDDASTPAPSDPGATVAAAPRMEAERAATAGVAPDRIAPRRVPTTAERAAIEPAQPKARQAAKPPTAAPTPAADAQRGGLPAALFGIALLLAAVGTMLVRARRRLIRPHRPYAARYASEGGHARRQLHEILANAEHDEAGVAGSPDGAERNSGMRSRIPLPPSRSALRQTANPSELAQRAEAGRSMRATDLPDIAASTLQPVIDPLPPEPIEAAPDVEQSLRELLAAWERRAA